LRARLIERLNEGLHRKLTLVSAPAGFGKTTMVSTWLAGCDQPVAWLSLDAGDDDSTRFLTYLIAAVQTVAAHVGDGVLGMLQSPQPPPHDSILTILLNEIATVATPFVLVLDDYHLIDAQSIDHALTFILEHLPPQMHLVIVTREDPHLPTARLRARGHLTELRAADLRFTPAESAEFLNRVMGLKLSTEDIAALETRTEGWIAGLQLAAISMQGQEDATRFIQSFTGSHHFVLDYLFEEVLRQQSDAVKTFLLHSSVLDQMCGPLCDAVLPNSAVSGQDALAYLQRANLFLIPLDNERRWYRYHHLFADVLRQRAANSLERGSVAELHARASIWYENNGYEAEAFHHAVAAEDFERAASLAEQAWQGMDSSFQFAVWLGWMKKLPDALIRARPILSIEYAQALMNIGEPESADSRLLDAERWLDATGTTHAELAGSSGVMASADKAQNRVVPAMIALARAQIAQIQRDVAGTVKYAELALSLAPEDDHLRRAQATVTLGLIHWAGGDLEAARKALLEWINSTQKLGNTVFAIATAFALADILVALGHLREAVNTYQQSLQLALAHDEQTQGVVAHLYLGLAMVQHEMGHQESAAANLLKSRVSGERSTLIDWPHRWHLAQSRLKESEGDLDAALDLLNTAKGLYIRTPVPNARPVEALKARIYVRQGRLNQALDWVHERGLSVDDDLSYVCEFEHMTLARVLIATSQRDHADDAIIEALGLLERLRQAAEASRRMGSVIEILVLKSLAYEAQSSILLALVPLERALTLAKPEGYIRLFVDEGPPMARLLYEALAREIAPDYVRRLLASYATAESQPPLSKLQTSAAELIEPLSERELEVLQFMSEGLTNQEISSRLFLSPHTVKVHARNIYGKLSVHNRTQAVVRARALGLLATT
jgi:LuxR family maltose regulon positive regulatory protein